MSRLCPFDGRETTSETGGPLTEPKVPKLPVPGPSPRHEQMLLQPTSQSGAALLPKSSVKSRSTVGFVDYPGNRLCLAVFASGLCSVVLRTVQYVACGELVLIKLTTQVLQSGFCASPFASCVLPWRDDGLCHSPNEACFPAAQSRPSS